MPIRVVIHPSYEWPGSAKSTKVTHRELEVLMLVGEGLDNKRIAERLGIKKQSVRNHMHHIMKKLGAGNNTQAFLKAVELGMVRLDIRHHDFEKHFDESLPWTPLTKEEKERMEKEMEEFEVNE